MNSITVFELTELDAFDGYRRPVGLYESEELALKALEERKKQASPEYEDEVEWSINERKLYKRD